MLIRFFLLILIISISICLIINVSCNKNSTEPEEFIDEELKPFAGKWSILSWLYKEITTDTSAIPDSSEIISECGFVLSFTVKTSQEIIFSASIGEAKLGEQRGKIKIKDEDEFIITMNGVVDTVSYFLSEDSTQLRYQTESIFDFEDKCSPFNLIMPDPDKAIPAILTVELQKE
jgi:hypothetical protein